MAARARDRGLRRRRDRLPLVVEISIEGRHRWGGVALLRDGVEAVRLDFAPVVLSALRLRPTRGDPDAEWAIAEVSVFAGE